ncbi:MAG: CvpA family protein [Casimicrobiaceae bacterium]
MVVVAMTMFDLVVVVILGLSVLIALVRGLVREVIALAAWIAALVVALLYSGDLATVFAGWNMGSLLAQVLAFAALFLGVVIAGGLIAMTLSRAVRAVGLGWVDRLLGGAFGLARGMVIVLVGVLLAGLTSLPRNAWWQDAVLAEPLVGAALQFRDWLPPAWAEQLDFSAQGPASGGSGMRVALPWQRES